MLFIFFFYNLHTTVRLKSLTSKRSKFLLTIAITRHAVAAALMHCCKDLWFDNSYSLIPLLITL